jgi:putative membrane protein
MSKARMIGALVAVVALAGTARAQWPQTPQQNPSQPPATPPAPTTTPPPATPPTTQPAPPTTQPTPAAQPASAELKSRLDRLHGHNVRIVEYARLASEKASSPRVKDLANKVAQQHHKMDVELAQLAAERGVQLEDAKAIASNPGQRSQVEALRAKSGPEFDVAFMEFLAGDRERQVDEFKAVRDATPGKDAKLKKWVDDQENVMEEQRNLAREVRKEAQRQGRTPPK